MSDSYDYIVVGAGSSGCVVANRLSADSRVLLLEAGGPDTGDTIHDPANIFAAVYGDPQISRPYMTEAQPGIAGRTMAVHRGIVLGGCSSINGMIYVRGNRADYDGWAAGGADGWSYDEVLPYFLRSERFAGGASSHHGVHGSLDVRWMPTPSPAARAFLEAGAALGRFPDSGAEWDFNGERQEDAVGLYQVTVTPEGRRASSAVAFLDPVRDRGNLTVETRAAVSRIVMENGRAVGVEYDHGDATKVARTDGEVILAAGAFESPKLLMLSGVGPAAHLRQHGIEPVVDLPGVGENLHDHLMMLIYSLAQQPTGHSGYLAEAGLFTHSAGNGGAPDLQYHLLAGLPGLPVNPETTPNFLFCPTLLHPKSRGTVRLRSTDPTDLPVVDPRYLEHEDDVEVLVRGIELARELLGTAPLAQMADGNGLFSVPDPTKPQDTMRIPKRGREGLEDFVRANATTVWHPVGSCRMGRGEDAVVDLELRVRGVAGLRVADASVMPATTSGNTNAPAIMIGEKAADLIGG